MSGRRPIHPCKARDVIKALAKLGFTVRHTKSSYVFLKHSDGRTTTIPVHSREELDRGLINKIAADIGMRAEELVSLVDEA